MKEEKMKNLYHLDQLDNQEIFNIIELATDYKNGLEKNFSHKKVANLFYEPSTRTNFSFISAQHNFNMKVVNVNVDASSIQKGESLYDTVKTFEALGYDLLVIRHPENEYYKQLDTMTIPILNGGDGSGSHPTQSLLDLMTIYEKFGKFEGLKVVIIGDIAHSRVAHTNINIMERLGMEVYCSGPKEFDDGSGKYIDFEEAIGLCDVVMILRVQFERHETKMTLSKEKYFSKYGIKMSDVERMKENAIIMHPAPFNRGVEIADDVVECDKSVIFQQMSNGVYIRMALIDKVFSYDS